MGDQFIDLKTDRKRGAQKDAYEFGSSSEEEEKAAGEEDYDESTSSAGSFFSANTFMTCSQNGDDVTITSVTSGVVTVTIKESVSPDGFFKKRDP